MSGSPKIEGRFRLDIRTSGDDIGASFGVRNSIKEYPLRTVDDTVEADFLPYRYQVGSKLRRALYNEDRREARETKEFKAKSKL
ncbi:hypothetical protein Y032_0113g409 [Ancylostoma ceylanicum]|uniref:Uncharacterized protein n=1 Tax=Ancylostoma ceylanicum TaxID=53326 RepID=A0A016TCU9_9BILA|nr:hypothetical protein Y032_0113g409 [Ancylostoma ceylanicum]